MMWVASWLAGFPVTGWPRRSVGGTV